MLVKPLAARSQLNGVHAALRAIAAVDLRDLSHSQNFHIDIAIAAAALRLRERFRREKNFLLLLRESNQKLRSFFLFISLPVFFFFLLRLSLFFFAATRFIREIARTAELTTTHARFHISPPPRGQFRKLSVTREPPTRFSISVNARDTKKRVREVEEKRRLTAKEGEARSIRLHARKHYIRADETIDVSILICRGQFRGYPRRKRATREEGRAKGEIDADYRRDKVEPPTWPKPSVAKQFPFAHVDNGEMHGIAWRSDNAHAMMILRIATIHLGRLRPNCPT